MRRRGFLAAAAAAVLTFETFLGARKTPQPEAPKDLRSVHRIMIDGKVYELEGPPTIDFVPGGFSIGGHYARVPQ